MPRRKKHPRLPNGYGSIRYLGKNRKNPYAVHPPADIDGNRPAALCYVDDWMKGFIILTAYKAGTYTPGMEGNLELPSGSADMDTLVGRLLADYSRVKGIDPPEPEKTFAQVYEAFYADKFPDGHKFAQRTAQSARTAFKNCVSLHDKEFRSLRSEDLQRNLDACTCKYATLRQITSLYSQMYKFADGQNWCDKDYSSFVKIKKEDDGERGVPFTDDELKIFWENIQDETAEMLVIMCYSGWRISEYKKMKVNLEERYFEGGIKTAAGKGRIVPIHSAIYPLVERRIKRYGKMLHVGDDTFRRHMEAFLGSVGITSDLKHTPHDCRHTFSRLCEKFEVKENDRKRMLGHAFQDVTNKVYGHRDIEDLRKEIEKIQINL